MASATIHLTEDADDNIDIRIEFDPPVQREVDLHAVHTVALTMIHSVVEAAGGHESILNVEVK